MEAVLPVVLTSIKTFFCLREVLISLSHGVHQKIPLLLVVRHVCDA